MFTWLKTLFAPFIPFSSARVHEYLGYEGALHGRQYTERHGEGDFAHTVLRYDHSGVTASWQPSQLPPGQALREPGPLFRKLDDSVVEEELSRLG